MPKLLSDYSPFNINFNANEFVIKLKEAGAGSKVYEADLCALKLINNSIAYHTRYNNKKKKSRTFKWYGTVFDMYKKSYDTELVEAIAIAFPYANVSVVGNKCTSGGSLIVELPYNKNFKFVG